MNVFQTSFHTQTFLYMMYAGFISCALFNLLRPAFYGKNLILVLIFDLFVSILTAFFLFLSIYYSGAGKMRLYMCFAFAAGGWVCTNSIGKIFKKWFSAKNGKGKSTQDGE